MQPNGVQGLRPQQVVLCRGVSMVNSKAFPTVLSLVTALVLFAVLGTALAAPDTSWQGTASDNVKVYVDPSATSRVVTILTRGVHVNVLVEIEALGIQWCRVQVPSENEPLGYARCTDIQRPAAQVSKAVQKQPISIATPAPAVSAPIVLEQGGAACSKDRCFNNIRRANKRCIHGRRNEQRYHKHDQGWASSRGPGR